MKSYTIARATESVPLDDRVDGTAWAAANPFHIDEFTWHESGPKPVTTGRALYDEDALYLQFHVEDRNVTAEVTELNGPTYQDSSVEFFADPTPEQDSMYFNFEPNCCGQFKLAWQEAGWQERGIGRNLVSSADAARVTVRTSVTGPMKEARADDDGWWLAAELPFDVLQSLTKEAVDPTAGSEWRGNFYRSGVESDSQKATWNPIEKSEADYHSPEYFGQVFFG